MNQFSICLKYEPKKINQSKRQKVIFCLLFSENGSFEILKKSQSVTLPISIFPHLQSCQSIIQQIYFVAQCSEQHTKVHISH